MGMIEKFTRKDFEIYLASHLPFKSLGLVQGEEAYLLPLDSQAGIMIRSSIKRDGVSASTGKDSIRCWLVSGDKPLGSKISKWTTRQPNWQERLDKNIKSLTLWRALAGDCKECGYPKGIFKAKTPANKGRPFARCREHNNSFQWLDEKIQAKDIYFSDLSKGDNNDNTKSILEQMAYICGQSDKTKSAKNTLQSHDTGSSFAGNSQERRDLQILPTEILQELKNEDVSNDSQMEVLAQGEPASGGNSLQDWITVVENKRTDEQSQTITSMPEMPDGKEPNKAQHQAIEADINSDVRVLAGPGAGKTLVIEYRYAHLVQNGVKPQNILVCTFGKTASENMAQRIQRTCPEANLEQICTINAFCSRLLTKWDEDSKYFKWQVPFDWKVKNEIENLVDKIWLGEKPVVKEVLGKIDLSKAQGLTPDESYQWFIDILGSKFGNWLYEIRCSVDAWLARNCFITFADQLYLVEQKLKLDEVWRTGLQQKFAHVIVDEAQDTTYQAMRILTTISLRPGLNTIYEEK